MKRLTIREIHEESGISVPTLSRWCRLKKIPNAEKKITPAGEFWEIPEADWRQFEKTLDEVKPGRPRKED
jgi:transcriptional regulator with XRE-family HTH domain